MGFQALALLSLRLRPTDLDDFLSLIRAASLEAAIIYVKIIVN